MSNTTFISEVERVPAEMRVQLTLDVDEVRALGDIARATIDASVLTPDVVPEATAANAENIYKWANRAANTLDLVTRKPDAQE